MLRSYKMVQLNSVNRPCKNIPKIQTDDLLLKNTWSRHAKRSWYSVYSTQKNRQLDNIAQLGRQERPQSHTFTESTALVHYSTGSPNKRSVCYGICNILLKVESGSRSGHIIRIRILYLESSVQTAFNQTIEEENLWLHPVHGQQCFGISFSF